MKHHAKSRRREGETEASISQLTLAARRVIRLAGRR